jgi:septum formation protein
MASIVLASASPRRRELMALSGLEFAVVPAPVPEVPLPSESAGDYVQRLSQEKAAAAAALVPPGAIVIGADTEVVLGHQIIGKPTDADHAYVLLQQLRGRAHLVLTGVTVLDTSSHLRLTDLVSARVPMRAYSDEEIEAYVATGNPLDKAGAYAIQFGPFQLVDLEHFQDCFANVMGLPVCRLLRLIRRLRPEVVPTAPELGDCQRYQAGQCPFVPQVNASREG